MKMYLMTGGVLAAMLAAAPAFTQAPSAGPQIQHRMAERGAAVRTRAEVPNQVRNLFARLDSNRDGFIARAEADAAKGQRGKRGGLARRGRAANPEVIAERRRGAFARLDANRDGMISMAEFHNRPARRSAGMRGGKRGGFAALRGRMFDLTDSNRDGRASIAEVTAAAYNRFDRSDLNRDGQLTRDERRARRDRRRGERGRG